MLDKNYLVSRLEQLQAQKNNAILTVHVIDGAIQEIESLLKKVEEMGSKEAAQTSNIN